MTKNYIVPAPSSLGLQRWADDVHNYLRDSRSSVVEPQTVLMQHQIADERATVDGLLMWSTDSTPVVSKNGMWVPIVLSDIAQFVRTTTATAAAVDTPYAIVYDVIALNSSVSLEPTYPSRIVFSDAGVYSLSFTAQIASTSASQIDFRFWPRVSGVNISGSTIVASLHSNGSTLVVSRTANFSVLAGDYLEAMWATTSTSGSLVAHGATAYSPDAPSSALSISRVR